MASYGILWQHMAAGSEFPNSKANSGKPIVGAQLQDLQGRPLANLFGVARPAIGFYHHHLSPSLTHVKYLKYVKYV